MIDTGTLIWLHAVHGVEPSSMPESNDYNTDIRVIAKICSSRSNFQTPINVRPYFLSSDLTHCEPSNYIKTNQWVCALTL